MFFSAQLLVLYLMELPWYFLLITNCFSFMVESAPPIIHAIKEHSLDKPVPSYPSFYCVFAIVCIPVCVLGVARKMTRARSAAKTAADLEHFHTYVISLIYVSIMKQPNRNEWISRTAARFTAEH